MGTTIKCSVVKEITLEDALNKLNQKAILEAAKAYNIAEDGKNVGTTIRFPPKILAFYESMAKTLDISLQAAVIISLTSMIEAATE